MKHAFRILIIALLVIGCTIDYVAAQEGQRGPRGGMGFMRGGNQADAIADALVLKADRAEKVTKIVEEVQTEMREKYLSGNPQDRSREEMMAAFQQMREKTQEALIQKLPAVLSQEELEFIKPLLSTPGGVRTVPEIRALRQIELNDETRAKLQTVVLIYTNTAISLRPDPSQFQGGGGQRGGGGFGGFSEENRAKMQQAQETLVADIKKILNEDQLKAWTEQTQKIQAELESQRQQRGGRQRGGGQTG